MNLAKGGMYQNLKPSITINILRYKIFPNEPAHSMYSIYNKETGRRLNEDMELHFLDVPKFKKKPVSEMAILDYESDKAAWMPLIFPPMNVP